jgi:competence protein ComEC
MSEAAAPGDARGGVIAAPAARTSALTRRARRAVASAPAAQAERLFLWTPVAFGCGAAAYMTVTREPPLWLLGVTFATALVGTAVWARLRRAGDLTGIVLLLLSVGAAGALAGGLRTRAVEAPRVADVAGPRWIEGWVVDVDSPGSAGPRLLIAPSRIQGERGALPARVRIGVKPDHVYGPGAPVRLRALLNPPPAPAAPGTYDFARDAFFRRIGGVGIALVQPVPVALAPPSWGERMAIRVNAARWSLARRIVDRMGPESGGMAVAMITGHEAWIEREDLDAMRDSGLAHVLSISGLHMAIVGGFVFFAVRLGAAAWPWLALRVSTKKLGGVAGLIAVLAYLALSGAPPPAVRAAVTAAVAFIAILCDRRAISLRALAFAALLVLALQPEAVLQPGFQMSFAATTALVALAEGLEGPAREINTPWPIALVQRSLSWIGLTLLVSLTAGLATTPFAIQHFNRVAAYGLVANLLSAPLTSFVLMPSLALGAVGEPAGVSAPALALAGWSVDALKTIARGVASLPNATLVFQSAPPVALAVSFLGLLFACLWRGPLRWVGVPLACAVLWWPKPVPPQLWVAAEAPTSPSSATGARSWRWRTRGCSRPMSGAAAAA